MKTDIAAKRISRPALIAALGFTLGLAVPAQAGFQWITPLDSAPVAKPLGLPEATPVAPKKELPPVVQLPVEQAPVMAPETLVPPAVEQPVPLATTPPIVEPAPVVVAPPVAEAVVTPVTDAMPMADSVGEGKLLTALEPGETIEGSGKATPLVVALKQTLPSGYIFAFEETVKPATPVDWQGGRGWRVVLAEALSGAGLVGYEQGNKISILKADAVVATDPTPVVTNETAPVSAPSSAMPVLETVPAVEVAPAPSDVVPATEPAMIEVPAAVEPVGVQPDLTPAPTMIVPEPAAPAPEGAMPEKQGAAPAEIQQAVLAEPPVEAAAPALMAPALPLAAEAETKSDSVSMEPVTAPVPTASEVPAKGQVVMPNASLEPPLLPGASDVWRAEPGEHLRDVIRRWASRAGVELVWSTEYDFPIQAGVSLSGSFEEAVRDLLSGFVDAKPQPFGRLHDNPNAGQRTLVVQTRGNTGAE